MGLEKCPCSVDLDGVQVELVQRLSDASASNKHTWEYAHNGLPRRWDEGEASARLVNEHGQLPVRR